MDSLHYIEKFCMPVLAGPSYVIKVSFFLYVLQMNSEKPSTQRHFHYTLSVPPIMRMQQRHD